MRCDLGRGATRISALFRLEEGAVSRGRLLAPPVEEGPGRLRPDRRFRSDIFLRAERPRAAACSLLTVEWHRLLGAYVCGIRVPALPSRVHATLARWPDLSRRQCDVRRTHLRDMG